MENRDLPMVSPVTSASSNARSLTVHTALRALVVGGATVAYIQLSAPAQPNEVVWSMAPRIYNVRHVTPSRHTEVGDEWAPGFNEPLGPSTTYAELAAAFLGRDGSPLPASEDFDLPEDLY